MGTSDWSRLDVSWLEKITTSNLEWKTHAVEKWRRVVITVGAGGIACMGEPELTDGSLTADLCLYNGCGTLCGVVPATGLMDMWWSEGFLLVIVFRSGDCRVVDIEGRNFYSFALDGSFSEGGISGIIACSISTSSILYVTSTGQLMINCSLYEKKPHFVANVMGNTSIRCLLNLNLNGKPKDRNRDVHWSSENSLYSFYANDEKFFTNEFSNLANISVFEDNNDLLDVSGLIIYENGPCSLIMGKSIVELNKLDGNQILLIAFSFLRDYFVVLKKNGEIIQYKKAPPQSNSPSLSSHRICFLDLSTYRPSSLCVVEPGVVAVKAVTAASKELCLLVGGPNDDWLAFSRYPAFFIASEVDGLRILTVSENQFMSRVDDGSLAVFDLGSCDPGAMLYFALESLDINPSGFGENTDLSIDDALLSIENDLPLACSLCLEAAEHQWDPAVINRLLRAVSLANAFMCTKQDSVSKGNLAFLKTCRDLRIVLSSRLSPVSIMLTVEQFRYLGAQGFVKSLTRLNLHVHALMVAKFFKLSLGDQSFIVEDWACKYAIRACENHLDSPSGDLNFDLEKIKSNLKPFDIDFSRVAYHLWNGNMPDIAMSLLQKETNTHRKVLRLVYFGETKKARDSSLDSMDWDLFYYVAEKSCSLTQSVVSSRSLMRHEDVPTLLFSELKMLLYGNQIAVDSYLCFLHSLGQYFISEALSSRFEYRERVFYDFVFGILCPFFELRERMKSCNTSLLIPNFVAALPKLRKYSSLSSNKSVELICKIMIETQTLLEKQQSLQRKLGASDSQYIGISLFDTISKLLDLGYEDEAKNLQSLTKVNTTHFARLQIKSFIKNKKHSRIVALLEDPQFIKKAKPSFLVEVLNNARLSELSRKICLKLEDPEMRRRWKERLEITEDITENSDSSVYNLWGRFGLSDTKGKFSSSFFK